MTETLHIKGTFGEKAIQTLLGSVTSDDYVRYDAQGQSHAILFETGYGYYIRTPGERTLISDIITNDMQRQIDNGAQIVKLPCSFMDEEFVSQEDLRAVLDLYNTIDIPEFNTIDTTVDPSSLRYAFNTTDTPTFSAPTTPTPTAPESNIGGVDNG